MKLITGKWEKGVFYYIPTIWSYKDSRWGVALTWGKWFVGIVK